MNAEKSEENSKNDNAFINMNGEKKEKMPKIIPEDLNEDESDSSHQLFNVTTFVRD